jgi:shikimate kinase
VCADDQNRQIAHRPELVALTGFMGAGKTTLGRSLANLLRWSFFDLDYEIELTQKMLVREIFQLRGESGFREIETDSLRTVLQQASGPTVVALGGGTFVQPANAELLRKRGAQTVFLENEIEELLQRCRDTEQHSPQNPRPLAATPEAFRLLYAQRLPIYRTADLTVDATGKSVEELTQEIVASLHLSHHRR